MSPLKGHKYFWTAATSTEVVASGATAEVGDAISLVIEDKEQLVQLVYAICGALNLPDAERNEILKKVEIHHGKGALTFSIPKGKWTVVYNGAIGFTALGNIESINRVHVALTDYNKLIGGKTNG